MQRMSSQESTLRKISECRDRSRQNETAGEVEPDGLMPGSENRQTVFSIPGDTSIHHDYSQPDGMKPIRELDENIFIYG
jgi:hypothetical protein